MYVLSSNKNTLNLFKLLIPVMKMIYSKLALNIKSSINSTAPTSQTAFESLSPTIGLMRPSWSVIVQLKLIPESINQWTGS